MHHGKTQNANEALNGTIWAKCPKTVFVGPQRVKAAVASAVSQFNQGASHLTQVMKRLQSAPSTHLSAYQQTQDRNRCLQADQAAKPDVKRQRLQRSRTKKTAQANHERHEGETYGPGML